MFCFAEDSGRRVSQLLGSLSRGLPTPDSCFSLAARCKPADVGNGESKVFVRVDWSSVDANFVMKVWSRAAAAQANVTDGVAAMDFLTRNYGKAGKVSIAGADAVAMVNGDRPAISAAKIGVLDNSVRWRDYR